MVYTLLYLEDCPYSIKAEEKLKALGKEYKKFIFAYGINKDNGTEVKFTGLEKNYYKLDNKYQREVFKDFFGQEQTFPLIFDGEKKIGGCDDLINYLENSP